MPAGPPAWFGNLRPAGVLISRVEISPGDDRPRLGADPIPAPPGAGSERDRAMGVKRVIPTPIATEINDFQNL